MNSRGYVRWLLRVLGLLLALGGATAMLQGWDIVQIERGWSSFIGGATALSGGAVVIALAEVVARLDRLLAVSAPVASASANPSPERAPAPAPPPESMPAPPLPSAMPDPAPDSAGAAPEPPIASAAPLRPTRVEAPGLKARLRPLAASAPPPPPSPLTEEPREIERYQSGGLTYVMFSDGSVELRSEAGAQRFSSIDELRTVLATQE